MQVRIILRGTITAGLLVSLAGCGGIGSGDSGLFGGRARSETVYTGPDQNTEVLESTLTREERELRSTRSGTKLGDLFVSTDPNNTVEVNKYLWQASREVLSFLPIQSVDPFSGVIVTGYGTPPGGGRAYRATIYVTDPALDARSLKVALATQSGPVDAATQRAVEDAILTRARQLRIQDGKL
jgi:hypothetical protein